MDNVSALLGGFADVITPMNLLFALLGVIVGTAVGVLPGIGPAMTVALLLPGAPMPLARLRAELFQRYGLDWRLGSPPPDAAAYHQQ